MSNPTNQFTPAAQIDQLNQRLLQLYVARDNLKRQVEQHDEEIAALRNLLGGVALARDAAQSPETQPKE